MIRNIVFDVGMVLIYWSPRRSMELIGFTEEECDIVINALFRDRSIWNEEDRGLKDPEEMSDFLVSFDPEHEDLIRRFYEGAVISAAPMEYTRPWITALKEAGYRVYILSNFGERAQKRAVELGAINFLDLVDGYIFSYTIHEIKPDRAIFDALVEKYDLIPEECVFIDDVDINVDGAGAAGMKGILFEGYEETCRKLNGMGIVF